MKLNFFSKEGNLKACSIGQLDASSACCLKRRNGPSHGLGDRLTDGLTNRQTKQYTDRQILLYRCNDASKKRRKILTPVRVYICLSVGQSLD